MKTKRNLIGFTLFILLFVLLTVTGCSQEKESTTGYIGIIVEEGGQSRGVDDVNELLYNNPEDLYWTYKAEKVSGDDTGKKTREYMVGTLGDHMGLREKSIGPLAVGDWKIELFGYLEDTNPDTNSDPNRYGYARNTTGNTLVYVSKEVTTYPIVSSTEAWSEVRQKNPIHVELKSPDSLKGYLEFGGPDYSDDDNVAVDGKLKLTVPEGQSFHGGKGTLNNVNTVNHIKVRLVDVTDSANPVVIAESKTNLSEDASRVYEPGEVIYLNKPVFSDTAGVKRLTKDSVEHTCYPFGTTETRNFVVVVEYMDGYSSGNSDYDGNPRYTAGEHGQFYEPDYAPVGDLLTFPLKFTGGVIMTLSGDVNDIKVNGGETEEVKFEIANYALEDWTEGSASGYFRKVETEHPKFFETLQDAVNEWVKENGHQNPKKKRITVLRGVDDAGTVNSSMADTNGDGTFETQINVPVPVYLNGRYIDSLVIDGTGSLEFCVYDADEENNYDKISKYTVSPCGSAKAKVNNISSKVGSTGSGKVVTTSIYLNEKEEDQEYSANCVFETQSNHTIYLSGKVNNVKVGKTGSTQLPVLKLGTKSTQGCEVAELEILGGKVEFGGWTKVTSLAVDTSVASGSTLKGATSAYVGNLDSEIRTGNILGTDLQKAVFKKVVLYGNNATETSRESRRTLYGIEGMYLNLLDFNTFSPEWTKTDTDGTELVFMNWNTESNVSGSTVNNAAKVLMGSSDMELYAVWAQSLGGRVFYVNDDEGLTNYHFYGAQHNELMYWRNALDKARELSAAAYVLNTSDIVKNKVYIAYTLTDPVVSVSAEIGLYEPTVYKWHTDYGTSASVPFETDDIGKGKEHTNAVLTPTSAPTPLPDSDDGSLFWGIRALRENTDAGRGHRDWFIGSKEEYTKLYESGVPKPERITSLTENDTHDKVFEYCGDMYTPTWSEKAFRDTGKIAFLLPLRSV